MEQKLISWNNGYLNKSIKETLNDLMKDNIIISVVPTEYGTGNSDGIWSAIIIVQSKEIIIDKL